jgi:hypothetical protein
VVEGRKAVAYLAPEGGKEKQSKVTSESILEKNEWTQLAATYDGSFLRLFVDGESQGQVRVEQARQPGDGHLRIGGRADGYSGFDEGSIDDVRLFSRALDATEIQRRFRQPDTFHPDALVQAWTFDPADAGQERQLRLAGLAATTRGPDGLYTLPEKAQPFWAEDSRKRVEAADNEVSTLEKDPPKPAQALAVEEGPLVRLRVHLRGDHLSPEGEPLPRAMPPALGGTSCPPPPVPDDRSGRLELAQWIADPRHPLAARVMVNRIWQADFGWGLVRTPDDFGLTGERSEHPELLDALALEFTARGGSFKSMHRLLLSSRAWRSASTTSDTLRTRDPDNRLFARASRRRLEAEMIRDAVLTSAGRLDPARGGSLVDFKNREYVPKDAPVESLFRRAVYLPVLRDRMAPDFAFFDAAQPSTCTGRRDSSVVALQALYFLNGSMVRDSATALAERLQLMPGNDEARAREAFRVLFSRPPAAAELERLFAFQQTLDPARRWSETCLALYASNEFLYLD